MDVTHDAVAFCCDPEHTDDWYRALRGTRHAFERGTCDRMNQRQNAERETRGLSEVSKLIKIIITV